MGDGSLRPAASTSLRERPRGRSRVQRLIADFLIAAPAAHHGLRVLTFDRSVFYSMVPHLLASDGGAGFDQVGGSAVEDARMRAP